MAPHRAGASATGPADCQAVAINASPSGRSAALHAETQTTRARNIGIQTGGRGNRFRHQARSARRAGTTMLT